MLLRFDVVEVAIDGVKEAIDEVVEEDNKTFEMVVMKIQASQKDTSTVKLEE